MKNNPIIVSVAVIMLSTCIGSNVLGQNEEGMLFEEKKMIKKGKINSL